MSSTSDTELKNLFDISDFNVYDSGVINLSVGAPGPDLLKECGDYFNIATDHRMKYEANNNYFLFQYGPAQGIPDYRKQLAQFLSEGYRAPVLSENLVLTAGASNGLHLILTTLLDMDGVIFVDEVTYMIALEAIAQFSSMKIIPVPLLKTGVNTHELKKLVAEHAKAVSGNKLFSALYYTIPTFHNPTGVLFSEDTCTELIQISRDYNILIACDDVYNLLYYNDDLSPKRLFAYDSPSDSGYKGGNVISNGSFSKILSPGVRIGWMECPQRIVNIFNNCGVIKSGGAVNNYTSGVVASLMELGLAQKILSKYRVVYKARMEVVCDILQKNLPAKCSFHRPSGGYFIWIQLPPQYDTNVFNQFCKTNYKILFVGGERFSVEKGFKNYFRITIGFQTIDLLKDGSIQLCNALKEFLHD